MKYNSDDNRNSDSKLDGNYRVSLNSSVGKERAEKENVLYQATHTQNFRVFKLCRNW